MHPLITRIHHVVLVALLVLAAPAALAQTDAHAYDPAAEIAHKASVSPRFAYVAAPPGTARNPAATQQHFADGFDPHGEPLTPDSRYWDFFTVDLEVLGKRAEVDPHDPDLHRVAGTIPGDAIVAVSHFYMNESQHLWVEMNSQVNHRYINRLPRGAYPRVRTAGDLHSGTHFTEEAGVTGPKLILNEDMRALEALSTNPDELLVVVHATPTLLSYSDRQGEQALLSPRALARMIRAELARQHLPANTTIRLLGCEAGRNTPGTYGAAQALADALVTPGHPQGNPVIAASGITFMNFVPTGAGPERAVVALPPSISPPRDGADVPRWQVYRAVRATTARRVVIRSARVNATSTIRLRARTVSSSARARPLRARGAAPRPRTLRAR